MVPFLAGVLMFFLLYLANLARQLVQIIPAVRKLTTKVVKKAAIKITKIVAEKVFDELEDRFVGKMLDYLKDLLTNQIEKIQYSHPSYYLLFKMIFDLLIDNIPDASDKIYDKFSSKIRINTKSTLGKIAANGMQHIFKIGLLLVLCAASFLINFQINKSIRYSNTKVSSQLTKGENYKDKDMVVDYVDNNEKIFDKEVKKIKID